MPGEEEKMLEKWGPGRGGGFGVWFLGSERGSEFALGGRELMIHFLAPGNCHFLCSGDDNVLFLRRVIPSTGDWKNSSQNADASDKQRPDFLPSCIFSLIPPRNERFPERFQEVEVRRTHTPT